MPAAPFDQTEDASLADLIHGDVVLHVDLRFNGRRCPDLSDPWCRQVHTTMLTDGRFR